jgi:predicted Zn-dependent protease
MKAKSIVKFAAASVVLAVSMGASCDNAAQTVSQMGIGGSHSSEIAGLTGAAMTVGNAATMNEETEATMGESLAVKVTNSPGLVSNNKLNEYVTLVGLTVASVCPRNDIDFTFGVLDSDQVNAVSGPHGYVFVTRGALMQMKDESELAGVLAHEIGHIVKKDGLHAVQNAGYGKAMGQVAQTAIKDNSEAVEFLTDSTNTLATMSYDKEQEKSADKEAVKYLRGAGYNPHGYANFIERLNVKSGGFFSSHPPTPDRVAAIRKAAGDAKGATLADRFHANTGF